MVQIVGFSQTRVSYTCMRWIVPNLCFLMLCVFNAQAPSPEKAEQAAIQRAKNALVSSLDHSLPKVSLEFFLNYEAGGAAIQ